MPDSLLVARASGGDIALLAPMANRHGLIAGATGTGKTVTLQRIAEELSRIGVPVLMTDVKGDLSGISQPGGTHPKAIERAQQLGITDLHPQGCPTVFWDTFGEQGHPLRITVSDLGPLLLRRLLGLNDTQGAVLSVVFRMADDNGLLLLDLKDLRAMLQHAAEHASEIRAAYGHVSAASLGAIQRALLALEEQGADRLFGEPALDLTDLLRTDASGRGIVNILVADRMLQAPAIYATCLLWLLAELFERLPEAGDLERPRLVLFFDEAHLLFDDAPKALLDKVEQVVRLIRSKGVGVYFVTQNPLDVPETVLGQLGNRVQHALRAFTPRDQKAVRAAASTFRQNPALDAEQAITELEVGEALVSFLDARGMPDVVQRAFIHPPASHIGAIAPAERQAAMRRSDAAGRYDTAVDRESAYEMLRGRTAARVEAPSPPPAVPPPLPPAASRPRGRQPEALGDTLLKSVVRAAGTQLGRQLIRGILGSLR